MNRSSVGDGFVVVCEDDAALYGQGATVTEALADAEPSIKDAVLDVVRDEIRFAKGGTRPVSVDLTWRLYPATGALRETLVEQGGHENWHKREDGTLEVGRKPPTTEGEGGKRHG